MSGFFAEVWLTFQILLGTFVVLILAFNFNQSWRRYPWDFTIDKFGFRVYVPFITSLALAVLMTILLRILPVGPRAFSF